MTDTKRFIKLYEYEKQLNSQGYFTAGVDEAGRGPLAGPVVAAAVIQISEFKKKQFSWLYEINDSKKITEEKREFIFDKLIEADSPFTVSVGIRDAKRIDEINILQATFECMKEAVSKLLISPTYILVDGTNIPNLGIIQEKIIKGDSKCLCIAVASIVAKVTRDRLMRKYDQLYPEYNFKKHKGYGTSEHIQAIKKFGQCDIHRLTFKVPE